MEIAFPHPQWRIPEMASFLTGIQSTYISIYIQKYIIMEIKQIFLLKSGGPWFEPSLAHS